MDIKKAGSMLNNIYDAIDAVMTENERCEEELNQGWVQIVHTLPIETSGGKQKEQLYELESTPK